MKVRARLVGLMMIGAALVACGGGAEEPVASVVTVSLPRAAANAALPGGGSSVAIQVHQALYGTAPGNAMFLEYSTQAATNPSAFAMKLESNFAKTSHAALAKIVLDNLGVTAATVSAKNVQGQSEYALLLAAVEQLFATYPTMRGQVIMNMAGLLAGLEADPTYGAAATAHNRQAGANLSYSSSASNTVAAAVSVSGTIKPDPTAPAFNMAQTISDGAQSTTMAFSGVALMTGNLAAQSFFPPGKVADYTGFQYLRDNDPDSMGHNTSFLTRIANNIIYILNESQLSKLSALAAAQQTQVDLYGYKRYPLMQAFRRLIEGNIPSGSTGLNLNAVKKASRELYLIDGQISFDRAVLYASVINSLDTTQKAYLDAMKGKGWSSWPDITDAQINSKMMGLAQGSKVAVMTYASDIFSWYAGSLEADIYFCPERHGTYYGGFYIKDAPAVGHEGYSIDEQMTATAGSALIDTSRGYVTQEQATVMYSLVATQKDNLNSIVSTRTQIATLLRTLLGSSASADSVRTQVLALSGTYGDLDGANNYYYATTFQQVYKTLTAEQKTKFATLRKSMMSGKYADGTAFDFSVASTPFLYSTVLTDAQIAPYISDAVTSLLFFEP